ncbi:uncharacterized protein B0I36DRAFT_279324 [Microdochium trichocladiopsis]|uniref:F-box domain-containing protein n=1 Tax=Microdochium trichocladiopsis TaxID=1682393 RepID=A0A9P9BF78_9PEZI|nr:uncharacterized protein B0I36DRAFT_279324 [Microdochium trichocladiopsis]KAH7010650.1 hypothetical protein B0I36DRAFT_279324 [Microdochium trichocladiopsis]
MALTKLPVELISLISSFLDTPSFLTLRYASRSVEAGTRLLFRRRYFSSRGVMLYEPSLENLLEIASSEEFRTCVETVIICLDHIPDSTAAIMYSELRLDALGEYVPLDQLPGRDAIGDYDSDHGSPAGEVEIGTGSADSNRGLQDHAREQARFIKSGIASCYLSSAFSRLPNLKSIQISDTFIPWGARSFRRVTGLRMVSTLTNMVDLDLVQATVQETLTATYSSSAQPLALSIIVGFADEAIRPDLLVPSEFIARFMRARHSVIAELCLSVSPFLQNDRRVWIDDFLSFVHLFPQLEVLDLGFNVVDEHLHFSTIGRRAHFPRLRELRLGYIACEADSIVHMVERHKSTLRELVLTRIELPAGSGSWPPLLALILGAELMVEEVVIEECIEGDLMLYLHSTRKLSSFQISKWGPDSLPEIFAGLQLEREA